MDDELELLVEYLTNQGLGDDEIQRVIAKLREHDQQTIRESVFDSIEHGTFNLNQIVSQAIEAQEC